MKSFAARFPLALILAGLLGITGIFLAGISAGFDFTDEGFYYLSFAHPENVSDNQSSFYFFGARLFALLGHNVVAMRVATLVASLGGTILFLHGVRRFIAAFAPELLPDAEHLRLMQVAALIASFLGYVISPPALAYNFQNAFCLLGATGLLLTACAQPRSPRALDLRTLGALVGFGGLVGLEFFIKFSSSAPLGVAGVFLFFLLNRKGPGQKAALAGVLVLCGGIIALIYFLFFQSFTHWWGGFQGTAGAIIHGGYAGMTIERYINEISAVIRPALRNFAPVWIVAFPTALLVPALRRQPGIQSTCAVIGGVWILAHLLWLVNKLDYFEQRQLEFLIGVLFLLGLLAASSAFATRTLGFGQHWRLAAGGLLLLLLPYLGAFGTNNNINTNCFYQISPWFVIAALLLGVIDHAWGTVWPSRIGLVLLAAVASLQFYDGYWLQPYRVAGGRIAQTIPTPIGVPVTNLRLNPETHDFIVNSRRVLQEHGFKPGDDLLVFFDLPGFVFAMGGVSPGHPWYFAGDRSSLALDLMRLDFIDLARRKRAFVVRNGTDQDWNEFLPDLRAVGLNFPEDYQLITPPMISPFSKVPFEIWRPRQSAATK